MPVLSLDELPPGARQKALKAVGRKRRPRQSQFSKDRARTYAIRCLAAMADLTPAQRDRCLTIAKSMNRI